MAEFEAALKTQGRYISPHKRRKQIGELGVPTVLLSLSTSCRSRSPQAQTTLRTGTGTSDRRVVPSPGMVRSRGHEHEAGT